MGNKNKCREYREQFPSGSVLWRLAFVFAVISATAFIFYGTNFLLQIVPVHYNDLDAIPYYRAILLIIPLFVLLPLAGRYVSKLFDSVNALTLFLLMLPLFVPFPLIAKIGELFFDPFYGSINVFAQRYLGDVFSIPWYSGALSCYFVDMLLLTWKLLPCFVLLNLYLDYSVALKNKEVRSPDDVREKDLGLHDRSNMEINYVAALIIPVFVVKYLYCRETDIFHLGDVVVLIAATVVMYIYIWKMYRHE